MAATGFLLLLGIAGLLVWGIKGSMGIQHLLKNKSLVKVLFIVYGLVLVASVFTFEVLPKSENVFVRSQAEEQFEDETMRLDQAIFSGKTEDIDPKYILHTWEWEYTGNELHIQKGEDWFNGLIIVDRKDKNDHLVEGTFYASTIIGGIDFTEEYRPYDVNLEKDILYLKGTWADKNFKFTVFEKEFVITQFNGEQKPSAGFSGFRDMNYLYLKIPKDLKIEEGTMKDSINYVDVEEQV
ncbi:hypothetical protein ACFSCZ_19645 [Siminovitchia sediminis]|uniref:Uncharacterized protein n=1 Tax=Siminovitchia sediminis TaxID=1274353 RepID=A0ABW4KP74_9BACI